MATNIINDLDSQLASLNQLKPPGASKGKITSITQLCVNNIQAESNIIRSLYRALKKAPDTHKLGAIYVIDSVVRRWIEQAKTSGQDLNLEGRGEPGTYPAAIKRVTELMPALFDDTLKEIPAEQKEKLEGMVKIWERGNTFPTTMLADFRTKLSGSTPRVNGQSNGTAAVPSATTQNAGKKTASEKFSAPIPSRPVNTPIGYPPQQLYDQGLIVRKEGMGHANGIPASDIPSVRNMQSQPQQIPQQQQSASASSDVSSILAALANTTTSATPQKPPQPLPAPVAAPQHNGQPPIPANIMAMLQQQGGLPSNIQLPPYQPTPSQAPFQMPQPPFAGFPGIPQASPSVPQQYPPAPPPQQAVAPQQQSQNDPLSALRNILPPSILNDKDKLLRALTVLKDLQDANVPMDQWGPVLEAFDQQNQAPTHQAYNSGNDYARGRDRSRSPDRSRRRASPVYGTYDEARKQTQDPRSDQRRYRQRSPMRNSPAPVVSSMPQGTTIAMNGMPMQPKYIAYDNSLPHDSIKVLSRTLFVGGANGSQQDIQQLFERFGQVQTCIANRDKRHAFVKMTTRTSAVDAKAGMERLQAQNDREVMNIARQTKWGVGFGPRECCDYARGESIIPINKLTDADMKWLLTAEYGGTGGQTVASGMVLEEPDIEIGAGVSSKAMSRRVGPDAGPAGGAKRQRDDGGQRRDRGRRHDEGGGGYGYSGVSGGAQPPMQHQQPPMQMEQYGYVRPEPVAVATPPAVPGFGFALPGAGQPGFR